jgi:hypothetical protein
MPGSSSKNRVPTCEVEIWTGRCRPLLRRANRLFQLFLGLRAPACRSLEQVPPMDGRRTQIFDLLSQYRDFTQSCRLWIGRHRDPGDSSSSVEAGSACRRRSVRLARRRSSRSGLRRSSSRSDVLDSDQDSAHSWQRNTPSESTIWGLLARQRGHSAAVRIRFITCMTTDPADASHR